MEIKKLTPEAYKLHDFLKENALGKDNAIKAQELCWRLGLNDTRTLRRLRAEVNSGISELNKKILTGNNGYYIAAADTSTEAYDQYKESAWRKIKTGVAMIQEGQRLLKMIGQDTQTRLDITGNLKDIEIYVKSDIKPIMSIMDDFDTLLADPLVKEAMKLHAKDVYDEEENDHDEYNNDYDSEDEVEFEYTKDDYLSDKADERYDEIRSGFDEDDDK